MAFKKIIYNIKKYRFEFRHLTILFLVLIFFQIILSFIQKESLQKFLENTQKWYQQDSAEKIANLTITSLELLLENINIREIKSEYERRKIIQSFNIIFSQQLLQHSIEDIFLIVKQGDTYLIFDDGAGLYDFLSSDEVITNKIEENRVHALDLYKIVEEKIYEDEKIFTVVEGPQIFNTFVPFVPNGEFQGVLYMRKAPDFANITNEIISSYEETTIIYSSLILLGLLAMYYISSYTLKERNETQKLLFEENQKHMKEQIIHEKELSFTKRIYHTHHKAEKVMGFIKDDLRNIDGSNSTDVINRVIKYSNFISRVIYDMKWYDPPITTIRSQLFNTDINEVIKFIIDHIFLRISSATDIFEFKLNLSENLPQVQINEFVIWEILEPLIQNCIDHSAKDRTFVEITTHHDDVKKISKIIIKDNGNGIESKLLEVNENNIKRIFLENESTKSTSNQNSGYGCYIAYQMAVKRCGWKIDADNEINGGAVFTITIKNHKGT